MRDIMLDLETLDTRTSAVILSIGAVRFDAHTVGSIGEMIHLHVDIDSNLAVGRTVGGSTIEWWLDQDEDARKKILEGEKIPLPNALSALRNFINDEDRVWGNGAAFDNVVVADAFKACGMEQPWRFWNDMCYRTLKNVFRNVPKPKFEGTVHDALDDAVNQAKHLQAIMATIRGQSLSEAA